jgi:hypothetical protein
VICTTLNKIRAHDPCKDRWLVLLSGLDKTKPDDEALPFARIVEICGLDDALWATQASPEHDREWRLFAVWCARRVQHLMQDARSIAALDVAERYALGNATADELAAARGTTWGAETAWGVAMEATWAAARGTAWGAAWGAADAAMEATRAAAWTAAYAVCAAADAARVIQQQEFLRVVS